MANDRTAELNQREQQILQAVVHSYITTAEPVGSRSIVKRFGMDLSPATVRNVMADLEDQGFLQQLHTSSGRVPTDRGYRYYVDYLMRVQELTASERSRIERELSAKLTDADEIMRQTSHMLALVSHQTGLVGVPDEHDARLRRIELMSVTPSRAAVMLVDNFGRVRTLLVGVEEPLQDHEVPRLNRFLNDNLKGVAMGDLVSSARSIMRALMDEQRRLAERATQLLSLAPIERPGQLFFDGATQLFEQPEFRDPAKAREVFNLLDEREKLAQLLRSQLKERMPAGPTVMIGSETHQEGLEEMSLVTSPYKVGEKTVGTIGVLGPRRMPYSKFTAVVDYTSRMLSRLLTRLAGGGA